MDNAPGVFKSLMNGVFREYLDKIVQVFIDDTLIYPRTMEERDELLRLVLQCLREHKSRETVEMLSRIHCLGNAIFDEGIIVDTMNVEAIMEWNALKNVPGVHNFWVWQDITDDSSKVFQR
jgi:hypothetical protein